jgi:mitochondrial fission protein ELM1
MKSSHLKRVWVLSDQRPGHHTQSLGVAQKLPFDYEVKSLSFSTFGRWPNQLLGTSRFRLKPESRQLLQAPWPDIAIGAGRKTAPILRYIKTKYRDCFTTYLMDPHCSLKHFDLVAIPQHDFPGDHQKVITTLGAPHSLTEKSLLKAADEWRSKFSHLANPRIAVLVGGNSKSAEFMPQDFHDLGEMASQMAREMVGKDAEPGSLLVTTSPRTGGRGVDYLRLSLSVDHELFQWKADAPNPYQAFLALSQVIIVTGDSMSMCAEACSLGKPVFIYLPRRGKLAPKLQRFHESLFERGLAQPLTAGAIPKSSNGNPLNEAGRIAQEILKRLG